MNTLMNAQGPYPGATPPSPRQSVTAEVAVANDRLMELENRVGNIAIFIMGSKISLGQANSDKVSPVPNGFIETMDEINARLYRVNERLSEIEANLQG